MKLLEKKHVKAIHKMAEFSWEWVYNTMKTGRVKCKLHYGKQSGYVKFLKSYDDGSCFNMDFEKLNEYHPMTITDLTWDILKVGYDLFLKELITTNN
jgi:hypothetical protein